MTPAVSESRAIMAASGPRPHWPGSLSLSLALSLSLSLMPSGHSGHCAGGSVLLIAPAVTRPRASIDNQADVSREEVPHDGLADRDGQLRRTDVEAAPLHVI